MSKTRTLDAGQEAPDPVEFAQSEIPAAPVGGDSMASALAMIAEALKGINSRDTHASSHLAGIERLLLQQESTRPHENLFNPPLISAYNPDGERDHPRPDLAFKVSWVGFDLRASTCTKREIELLNRLTPGEFRVTKSNGRTIPFKVSQKVDDAGKIERMSVHFPCKTVEDRADHRSMVEYLQEVYGEVITPESLHAEIARLKQELASRA